MRAEGMPSPPWGSGSTGAEGECQGAGRSGKTAQGRGVLSTVQTEGTVCPSPRLSLPFSKEGRQIPFFSSQELRGTTLGTVVTFPHFEVPEK